MALDILPTDTTPIETEFTEPDPIVESTPDLPAESPATDPELPGYDPKESTRDTVARVLKEQAKTPDNGDNSGEKKETTESKTPENAVRVKGKDGKFVKSTPIQPDAKFDPELYAPERFNPAAKKAFEAAPEEIKREIHRTIKNLEGTATRAQQQYAQAYQQVSSVAEIVRPFAPKWAEKGFTVPQALGEICSTFEKLNNPQTALQEYVSLGQRMGVDFNNLASGLQNGQVPQYQQPQNQIDPNLAALQEENNQIKSYLAHQEIQQQIAPVVNSARSVMDEVDQNGNLRFPELHDNDHLLSLKPRVSELLGNIPGLTFNDALLRANEERLARLGISRQPQLQNRLPGQQNNQFIAPQGQQRANAVNAAVSVRGRSTPQAISGDFGEPPPDALKSARATTAWVAKQMQQGRI